MPVPWIQSCPIDELVRSDRIEPPAEVGPEHPVLMRAKRIPLVRPERQRCECFKDIKFERVVDRDKGSVQRPEIDLCLIERCSERFGTSITTLRFPLVGCSRCAFA